MAKKKSTMSLKDFHGGVIPTDLQLPSAPGMTVDRGNYDRHQGWNNNRGYGGDRGRQTPANGYRAFEDKASYFVNNGANIGRNFDEDERRPMDNRPRSSPANERSSMDLSGRHDKLLDSRVPDRHSRDSDNRNKTQVRQHDRFLQTVITQQGPARRGVSQGFTGAPATPSERQLNAWGVRDQQREVEALAPWRVRNNVARIAEASAIDKVSSGRWQPGTVAGGLERTRSSEEEKLVSRSMQDDSRKVDTLQITHSLEMEDDGRRAYEVHPSVWTAQAPPVYPSGERVQTPGYPAGERVSECVPGRQTEYGGPRGDGGRASEGFRSYDPVERSDSYRRGDYRVEDRYRDSGREEHYRGSYDRLEVHGDCGSQGGQDMRNAHPYYSTDDALYLERFPQEVFLEKFHSRGPQEWERSRPVHTIQQQPPTTVQPPPPTTVQPPPPTTVEAEKSRPRSRNQHDHYEVGSLPGIGDAEHAERPKLNLKPRSLPSEEIAGSERERQTLFGGARPRELVLKERGIDDVTIAGLDTDNSDGSKSARTDTRRQQGGRYDTRNGKAKQELMRSESDRYDGRRDYVRQDQPQEVKRDIDRRDSWRRSADPAVSALAELPSRPPGKLYAGATSAMELAQTFSRLTSATPSTRYNTNNRQRAVDKHNAAAW